MKEWRLQNIYSKLNSRRIRIALFKSAELIGIRHLLVRMDTNNLCDLRCEMCPEVSVRQSKNFKPVIMPLEDFKNIAEMIFCKAHMLYLSCTAEPLLTPRFEEYIRVAGAYKVPFLAFITNGMKLAPEIITASIESGVSQIVISADGASAKTFESVRGGASFSRLLENLSMIRNIKAASHSKKPEVRLNFTISKINWFEVDRFTDIAFRYGADSIQYRPLTPFANSPWSIGNQLDEKEEKELNKLLELAARKALEYGIKLLGHGEFTGKGSSTKGSPLDRCAYPWFFRFISPNGDLAICPQKKPVGNILASSYKHIMKDEGVRGIKTDSINQGKECLEKCRSGLAITEL